MNASTTPAPEHRSDGAIAIAIAVSVGIFGFAIGLLHGWVVLLVMLGEMTAVVLGVRAWRTGLGKLAVLLAALVTIAAYAWLLSPVSSRAPAPPPGATP